MKIKRDWCYDEGGQMFEYVSIEEAEKLKTEIERLQGIVNKLPKTADGVPVVPAKSDSHPRSRRGKRDVMDLDNSLDIARETVRQGSDVPTVCGVYRSLLAEIERLQEALEESHALNVNWVSVAEPDMLEHLSEYKIVLKQAEVLLVKAALLAEIERLQEALEE